MLIKKGAYVRIYNIVLKAEERTGSLPEDTKKVPLEMWVKGFLLEDANIGEEVKIKTITGRVISGKLLEENPVFRHSYGEFVPELLEIGIKAREILFGGDANE